MSGRSGKPGNPGKSGRRGKSGWQARIEKEIERERDLLIDYANAEENQKVMADMNVQKRLIKVPRLRFKVKTNPLRFEGWMIVRDASCQSQITYVKSGGHRDLGDSVCLCSPLLGLSPDRMSLLAATALCRSLPMQEQRPF